MSPNTIDTTRWRITGTFTTRAPMHVGNGALTSRESLKDKADNNQPCDVQAVVKDHANRPCIPGTALKGVLRAWAERFFLTEDDRNKLRSPKKEAFSEGALRFLRIFGREITDRTPRAEIESGWAEFGTVTFVALGAHDYAEHVPYWCARTLTGVASNVCIDRDTGAARANKLFFQEFVPEGVAFTVDIRATRLSPGDVALLLAALEGAGHDTHPYQFGANGADGWGRGDWELTNVQNRLPGKEWADAIETVRPLRPTPGAASNHEPLVLALDFQGPFLVNDASHAHQKTNEGEELPKGAAHFVPLTRADGAPWLPASSFRGALRARAEFLLRSAREGATGDPNDEKPNADGPIERLFGTTRRAARLRIDEPEVTDCGTIGEQDFVAIDRFTGGAADKALFRAKHVLKPKFRIRLSLDTDDLKGEDRGLLAAALRDVCRGAVTFGFGGAKGYGEVRGALEVGEDWVRTQLEYAPTAPAPSATGDAPTAAGPTAPPADIKQGQLVWQGADKKRKRVLVAPTNKLPYQLNNPKELSANLTSNPADAIDVDFELDKGQPVRIRPRGEQWTVAASAPRPGTFGHPYYFIALNDREKFAGELADAKPTSHARYFADRYSGTIKVRLTTKTPLLLCDTNPERVEKCTQESRPKLPTNTHADHKVYPVRLRDGKPDLPSSSVRGMLRAAFEAITNSRFGVFPCRAGDAHTRRLGYRTAARSGLDTVPVRIETHGGKLVARLLPGTSTVQPNGRTAPNEPVFAALVARYDRTWTMPEGANLTHGTEAWAFVWPWEHTRFRFWNVEALRVSATMPTNKPTRFRPDRQSARQSNWAQPRWVRGWLCVTERNIDGKHDERFFFESGAPQLLDLADGVAAQWHDLITNYQTVHEDELRNGDTRPPALKDWCRFSRHITHNLRHAATSERVLVDGTLAYAALEMGGKLRVAALYPVMISRRLFDKTPFDLLPKKLRPATNQSELSPADRVFGWVNQQAQEGTGAAYRAQLRVGPVTCITPDAVTKFAVPKALAILGQPKPQQGRFYLGRKQNNGVEPIPAGTPKEQAGYMGANRVRGPKVYPHHAKFDEAKATTAERSNQNRSVDGWVKERTEFTFELHVTNMTAFELGALAWLLEMKDGHMEDGHFLRLGLGKPLGFGSVRAEIVPGGTRVATGAAWIAANDQWEPAPESDPLDRLRTEFKTEMNRAHPTLLKQFLRAASGFGELPIHYPQVPGALSPSQHFEWFVRNEKDGSKPGERGQRFPLPDLLSQPDCSLPTNPTQ